MFWYNSRDVGECESSYEVQPDGYAEIIFYFGSLAKINDDDGPQPLPSPFMMGLLNKPAIFRMQGRLQIIGIRCYPWTVFDLLGLPSAKADLHTFQHPIAKLQSVLSAFISQGKIDDAIAALTQYFTDAHQQIASNSLLYKAGAAMNKAKGTLPVNQVAEAAHATVRTLERNFKQSSGFTVKDVSALMRFEQVRNRLWTQPDVNLAGLAHELGIQINRT